MHVAWIITLLAVAPVGGPMPAWSAVVIIKLSNALSASNGASFRSARR